MDASGADPESHALRHLRIGWWSLLLFLTLGIVLETMHGFKIRLYVDVSNETRRLMWTLAHAHGTLLSLVHIALGSSARFLCGNGRPWPRLVSPCLTAATVLLPGGFFLGGIFIYGGDPGLGILLVPLGAVFLLVSVLWTARSLRA